MFPDSAHEPFIFTERFRLQQISVHALPPTSTKNFKGTMKPVQSQSSSSSLPHKTHAYKQHQQQLAPNSPANALTTLIK